MIRADLTNEELYCIFKMHADGRLAREGVPQLFELLLKSPPFYTDDESRVTAMFDRTEDERSHRGRTHPPA